MHIAARLLLSGLLAIAPVTASAQLALFTDRSAFLAAVLNPQTDTFSDLPAGFIPGPLNRTVGTYAYRASTAGFQNAFFGGSVVPSGWLSTNNADGPITFDNFTGSVRAFGGDFFGSSNNVLNPMTFDVVATTVSGATLSLQLVNPSLESFVGFVSTEALTSVELQKVSGIFLSADNVVLAQYRTVVPEPSSVALIGAGLIALCIVARRRQA